MQSLMQKCLLNLKTYKCQDKLLIQSSTLAVFKGTELIKSNYVLKASQVLPTDEQILVLLIFFLQSRCSCYYSSNFCRKKFYGSTKTFLNNFGGCNLQKSCIKTSRFIQQVQKISFFKPGIFFLQKFEKLQHVIFWLM